MSMSTCVGDEEVSADYETFQSQEEQPPTGGRRSDFDDAREAEEAWTLDPFEEKAITEI